MRKKICTTEGYTTNHQDLESASKIEQGTKGDNRREWQKGERQEVRLGRSGRSRSDQDQNCVYKEMDI